VWFPAVDAGDHEVKDIRSGDQTPADPATWTPPPEDLRPTMVSKDVTQTEGAVR
jgi:histidyl-tRNA synthetase